MSQPSVKSIWLELQIDPNDPALLAILDRLVRSGMLDRAQILQIASTCLSEDIELPALPVAVTGVVPPPTAKPAKIPSSAQTLWRNLKDELSVRWLLFLGVFLVILSSGVLAATQWSLFPAWGQYGLLWLYTIGFWVVGGWARRQEGLRLTAQTLQIVTLLLIPVNFWAIDSFGLWQQPLELVTALVAIVGLMGIVYLKYRQQQGKSDAPQLGWLLLIYLGLGGLQLGWQIQSWSTIAIYIGAIGVAIWLPKIRQREGGALAIYGVGVLLLRGLVVTSLPLNRFGLAIGIVGWLWTQWGLQKSERLRRLERVGEIYGSAVRLARYRVTLANLARLYQRIGASLLMLGWLLGIGDLVSVPTGSSWQAVAVSCLALQWLWQRLRSDRQHREAIWLFLVGLQAYVLSSFLWLPLDPGRIFAWVVPILIQLFGQNYFVAGSLTIFPYLLLWVWITDRFWRKEWHSIARTGESLILWTGAILVLVNLTVPLSLFIDLLASTLILAHLTLRYLPVRTSYIYLTHLCGVGTIFAALGYRWDWCRAIASNFVTATGGDVLAVDLLVMAIASSSLAVVEFWLCAQPVRRNWDGWQRSSANFGLGLAIAAYGCLLTLATYPEARSLWLWWVPIPIALTYVATRKPPVQPWQLTSQTMAAWWAIAALGAGLVLTIEDRLAWQSAIGTTAPTIFLLLAVGLMFPLFKRLQQLSAAVIQIGFGLGAIVNLLAGDIFPGYWSIVGAIACGSLWFISRKLPRLYALASDRWAIAIAGIGLIIGSIDYIRDHLNWLVPSLSLPWGDAAPTTQWFESRDFTTLLATGILVAAIRYRQRWQNSSVPDRVWFWGCNWTIQIALSAVVHLVGGDTLALATLNIILSVPLWVAIDVGDRRHPERAELLPESKLLPSLLAGWGLILRLPFFTTYTGLLTAIVGVVGVLTSRRLEAKAIGYGGMLLVTLGGYELVTHYLTQAPVGGSIVDALTVYGLVTAVLALSYRLGVWWRWRQSGDRWWDFPLADLTKVAHVHWAVASAWNLAAASVPTMATPRLTWLHLAVGVLLGGYAALQARAARQQPAGSDWWIYVGLVELLGVGIYARSIFQNLGIIDEGLILLACLVGLLLLLAPWRQWGWHDRPWRIVALVLPLTRVVFEWERISLLNLVVLAVFYAAVARRQRRFGWAYLSLVFINWAGMRLLFEYQLTSPIWYALLVGLSILVAVQWDPYWQNSQRNRHYGRIGGSGTIAVTALVWHQPWLPIALGLAIALTGLVMRVRAWFYVGTVTFLLTITYQLLVLIADYSITKWAIGLLAGILIITLAANFERRKEQIERALQHWLDRLQEWE
ncbi:hypothetical protein [Chamaesiphon sp.]|uniref:hypothetical protein n=1 Tax=Chamaesiphon sp. TaxID=2814140 RepID=UPI003593F2DC